MTNLGAMDLSGCKEIQDKCTMEQNNNFLHLINDGKQEIDTIVILCAKNQP